MAVYMEKCFSFIVMYNCRLSQDFYGRPVKKTDQLVSLWVMPIAATLAARTPIRSTRTKYCTRLIFHFGLDSFSTRSIPFELVLARAQRLALAQNIAQDCQFSLVRIFELDPFRWNIGTFLDACRGPTRANKNCMGVPYKTVF